MKFWSVLLSFLPSIHNIYLQAEKSPNDVKKLFENKGLHVLDCVGVRRPERKPREGKVSSRGSRMFCYVQFNSIDDAILGLANFGNSFGMRVSFAKDNIAVLKKNCIEKKLPLILGDQKP